ncbi:hypothetical protein WIW50_15235 [Flavobacteriaceae bacterium 3-367]|uniref:hypothetical protein n=1 Tax=Eudoraea algarum TaxID=3417568 RepID=UPI003272B767
MKKLFSFVAILAIIFASNCSRIPENNDPVIGIWTNEEVNEQSSTDKQSERREWIFNDAYLGRFHSYINNELTIITDFQWSQEDGVYTISYPGIAEFSDDIVTMEESEAGTLLKDNAGNILAVRE